MTDFSIAWLDLREPADLSARDKPLARRALQWLEQYNQITNPILVDLGSGTGSSLRALEAQGAHNLVWRLVDRDGGLLNEALRRHSKNRLIEDYRADLTLIHELPLGGANLVTASALFDLASREFVDALVTRLSGQATALYAALNYDGTTEWEPAHPLDAQVLAAFNQDQHRDKGFGPALGAEAAVYLASALQRAGYSVSLAKSPWQLGAADAALVAELIRGIAAAVAEKIEGAELNAWQDFRLDHAASGRCSVGHLDLLALPLLDSEGLNVSARLDSAVPL